ncbi:AbrB/MazE/SpoVT family DNA-binding domain-containing protein, partial [Candidatus Woesearchaeota archaeon]|nr:AbrB/MazE/SpoVT family DNA-binding domain-containing protein [Candidatus Woesearchaeota archaeon]
MVKRKVSLIGPSTLMVSLPSKWVKAFGIKKGDEIEITENGSNLLLESQRLKKGEALRINLTGLNANLIY